jgi:nucleoside 2-deoxyribosyltransferase
VAVSEPAAAPLVYIAGPLFDDGERWWMEGLDALVRGLGFATFLPHRDNPPKDEHNVRLIFQNDKRAIDRCELVVASLNGITTDDGTAWEIGYAYALGKPIVGIHTDWRARFAHEVVNLMIENSLTSLARSIDELTVVLEQFRAGPDTLRP